jgi:hypothetical protein
MVGMFVGDQDCGEGFGVVAGGMETVEGLLAGQAGIDEKTGPLRGDQRGIAGARRRENRNLYDTIASRGTTSYYNVVGGGLR